MTKFNHTITAYLVPYITEGYDNKKFCYWMSLLLKVEHITWVLMLCLIYTHLPSSLWPSGRCVHIRQSTHTHGITITPSGKCVYIRCPWYNYICNSYNMGMSALPDMYALARGAQARGQVCIYQAKHEYPWYN